MVFLYSRHMRRLNKAPYVSVENRLLKSKFLLIESNSYQSSYQLNGISC